MSFREFEAPRSIDDLFLCLLDARRLPDEAKSRRFLEWLVGWPDRRRCKECGSWLPQAVDRFGKRHCLASGCPGYAESLTSQTSLRSSKIKASAWIFAVWEASATPGPMNAAGLQAAGISNRVAHRMMATIQNAMVLDVPKPDSTALMEAVVIVETTQEGTEVLVDLLWVHVDGQYRAWAGVSEECCPSVPIRGQAGRHQVHWWEFRRGWARPPKDAKALEDRIAEFNYQQRWKGRLRSPGARFVHLMSLLLCPIADSVTKN